MQLKEYGIHFGIIVVAAELGNWSLQACDLVDTAYLASKCIGDEADKGEASHGWHGGSNLRHSVKVQVMLLAMQMSNQDIKMINQSSTCALRL